MRDDNPVMIFEHKLLYGSKGARTEPGAVDATSDIPDGDYIVPLERRGPPLRSRKSTYPGLAAHGPTIAHAGGRRARGSRGSSARLSTCAALAPLDWATIGSIGREDRTGRHRRGRPKDGGLSGEIAAGLWNIFPA